VAWALWQMDDPETDAESALPYYRKMATTALSAAAVQDADEARELVERLADGNRPVSWSRDDLGRFVREAWVRWAETQPNPKPSWLIPYTELSEVDKEADRQIGEAVARWTLIGDAANAADPICALLAERDEARAEIERLRSDAELGCECEGVIALKTHFTGDHPYVGNDGVLLALNEALDRADAAQSEAAALRALVVRLREGLAFAKECVGSHWHDDCLDCQQLDKMICEALALTPADLADCVVVKREDLREIEKLLTMLPSSFSRGLTLLEKVRAMLGGRDD